MVQVARPYLDSTVPVGRSSLIERYAGAIERGDFIGVYPDGLKTWNIGREDSKADDVEFVHMMMDYWTTLLESTFPALLQRAFPMVRL